MTTLADNRLVRAVARVPTTVQRKLLFAFAGIVGLLIVLGVLGLRELSASNDRVVSLGQLPLRIATYRELQLDTAQLGELFAARNRFIVFAGGAYPNKQPADNIAVTATDGTILSILTRLGPFTGVTSLGFVPLPGERSLLADIHSEFGQVRAAMSRIIADDQAGKYSIYDGALLPAQDVVTHLEGNADQLVSITQADAASLIAKNQASNLDSQHLVIGVAAGSILLALLLGLVLSGSLIVPIQQVRARLAAITSGDFSEHVSVPNRDELGALAVDLNRMNDELGRLYRELQTASLHKSEFLANMSHELRTPLNAVIGFSEVLQDRLFGDLNDEQAEYVADIHASGQHLLALINDILDLSKIEAGRMELQVSGFALCEVLQNSTALSRERANRLGVGLSLEVDPSIGIITADERKLKQVLFNLLTNALKFTARGGHVNVTAHRDSDGVVVSVRDDGVGIAEADQARIFEEFQQVGTSHWQEGTGLGLALSRRLVELHGGRLWVASEPGKGSTFAFNMPLAQNAEAAREGAAPSQPEAAGVMESRRRTPRRTALADGQLVLIVEDNEKNLKLARNVLRYHGFRTIQAADAETGLRMASESAPDIILMDIQLPGIDGVTALLRLQADPATASIPVVAVTASVMPFDRERFARVGLAGVIVKPIDVKEFPNQVLSYCTRSGKGG